MRWKNQKDLKLASFNVRGLIQASKQSDLICVLAKFGVHICGIQETHVVDEQLRLVFRP